MSCRVPDGEPRCRRAGGVTRCTILSCPPRAMRSGQRAGAPGWFTSRAAHSCACARFMVHAHAHAHSACCVLRAAWSWLTRRPVLSCACARVRGACWICMLDDRAKLRSLWRAGSCGSAGLEERTQSDEFELTFIADNILSVGHLSSEPPSSEVKVRQARRQQHQRS